MSETAKQSVDNSAINAVPVSLDCSKAAVGVWLVKVSYLLKKLTN
jgi:hypothetical protein